MDGPFYQLKRINPYYMTEWRKDSDRAPTYHERIAELKALESQIAGMGPTEQEEWALRLEKLVKDDPSPEIRRQSVRCAAKITSQTSTRILNAASGDDVDKVRLAACDAWKDRQDEPAKAMLLSLAKSDSESSVRQAAIEGLGQFEDPEVIRNLSTLLDDRSPAVVYNVTQSLANITGQEHGGNVQAWKNYLRTTLPAAVQPNANSPIMTASGEIGIPSNSR